MTTLLLVSDIFALIKQEWLDKSEKKQNEAKLYENPVLVVKDIEAKQGKLDRELLYLLNKAKYYVPKPKVNETGTNHVLCTLAIMRVARALLPVSRGFGVISKTKSCFCINRSRKIVIQFYDKLLLQCTKTVNECV